MDIAHGAHVLVADKSEAVLFRNAGSANEAVLVKVYTDEQSQLPDSKPGSDTVSLNLFDDTEPHQGMENSFAARLGEEINSRVLVGEISQLFVIAMPQVLGLLRGRFHASAKRTIRAEIARDMVRRSGEQIAEALRSEPSVA